jgi:fucose permease
MKPSSPKIILFLACSIFLIFGLFNAAIGPVLSELASQTTSSLSAIGGVITFLFLGSLIAQIVAGPLTERFGQKSVLVVSLIMLSVGIIGFINAHTLTIMYCMVFFTGLGQGGVDLGANLVVANAFPKNNTSVLNLLHFFFGLGAFFGPALVSLAITISNSGLVVHWAAAGLFLLLAGLTFTTHQPQPKNVSSSSDVDIQIEKKNSVYGSPLLWMIGFMLLLYVGVEYGLGSWATTFMETTTRMPIQTGALVTSAYWGFLTLGRLAGAIASRKLTKIQLLGVAISGSLVGAVAFALLTGTTSPVIIALVVIGFCFGTIYPTLVAVTIASFPQHQGKAVGAVTAMGSIGGLSMPLIAGVLLEKVSPSGYVWYITGSVAFLLVLFAIVRVQSGKHKPNNV